MSEENPAQGIGDTEKPQESASGSEDSIYISVDARNVCYDGGVVPLLAILRQLNRLSEISELSFQIEVIAPGWIEGLREDSDEISKMSRLIPIMTWKRLKDDEVDDYLTVALAKVNNGYYISNDSKMHEQIGEDDDWRKNNQIKFTKSTKDPKIQPWQLKIPKSEFSETYKRHFENADLLVELNEKESKLLSEIKERRKWQRSGWMCPTCGSRFSGLSELVNHTKEEGHSEDFNLEDASMVMRIRSKKPVRKETIDLLKETMDKYRSIPFEELSAIVTGVFEGALGRSGGESLIVELRDQVGLFVICKQRILEGAPKNIILEVRKRLSERLGFESHKKTFLYIFTEEELDPLDPYWMKNTDRYHKERIESASIDIALCATFPSEADERDRERVKGSTVCKLVTDQNAWKEGKMVIRLQFNDYPIGKVIGRRGNNIKLINDTIQRFFGTDDLKIILEITESIKSESNGWKGKLRFQCPECKDRFAKKSDLDRHRSEERHACTICEECAEIFMSVQKKNRHVKKHLKEDGLVPDFSGLEYLSHDFKIPKMETLELWYNNKDLDQLRKFAKDKGKSGFSKLNKGKLIELLLRD